MWHRYRPPYPLQVNIRLILAKLLINDGRAKFPLWSTMPENYTLTTVPRNWNRTDTLHKRVVTYHSKFLSIPHPVGHNKITKFALRNNCSYIKYHDILHQRYLWHPRIFQKPDLLAISNRLPTTLFKRINRAWNHPPSTRRCTRLLKVPNICMNSVLKLHHSQQ